MTPAEAALRERLLGAWRLITWRSMGDDGSVDLPMGPDPDGIVVYTPDGTMMTTIGRGGRPPIGGGDMLAGPDAERLAAFSTFIAYTSRFRIEGTDVIHSVVMSLFPDWVGSDQRRHVVMSADGRDLELSSDPMLLRGSLSRQVLTWRRIDPDP